MSKNPLKINSIRTQLLKVIDSEIKINKVKEELPSLNKSPLDFHNNILIEIKDYSHSLQKIMRGFDTFLKRNMMIKLKRKEKIKISNSLKNVKSFKNLKYPFKYLRHVCSSVKIPVKGRSRTEISKVLEIDSDFLIGKNRGDQNIHFDKFILNF